MRGWNSKINKMIKAPLIVLESYMCVCVPFLKKYFTFFNSNGDFKVVLRGGVASIWWGVLLNFLNIPSIVTGNLESILYT